MFVPAANKIGETFVEYFQQFYPSAIFQDREEQCFIRLLQAFDSFRQFIAALAETAAVASVCAVKNRNIGFSAAYRIAAVHCGMFRIIPGKKDRTPACVEVIPNASRAMSRPAVFNVCFTKSVAIVRADFFKRNRVFLLRKGAARACIRQL